MNAETQFRSGADLLAAMQAGALQEESTCIAMVKQSDKHDHIALAPRSCKEWVDVPTSLIGAVRVLRHVPCGGHSHPLAQVDLLLDSANPLHGVLKQLLCRSQVDAQREIDAFASPAYAMPPAPPQAFQPYGTMGPATGPVWQAGPGTGYAQQPAGWASSLQAVDPTRPSSRPGWPGSVNFSAAPGRSRVAFAAPIGPGGIGGGKLGFIECDIDCCAACCRDCFPWVGCVDYPCCWLTNCRIVI